MPKTKIPTDKLTMHAVQYMHRVLAGLDDDVRRVATANLEAGGAYEVRVCMGINREPCISLAIVDDAGEGELHMVGGGPA